MHSGGERDGAIPPVTRADPRARRAAAALTRRSACGTIRRMRRDAATATGAALAAGAVWSLPALAPLVPSLSQRVGIPRTLPARRRAARGRTHVRRRPAPARHAGRAWRRSRRRVRAPPSSSWESRCGAPPRSRASFSAAGHGVALHGDTHRLQLRLTPRALAEDLDRGYAAIADAAGVEPRRYRPPFGIFRPAGLALVHRRGWAPLLWSQWGHDWRLHRTPGQIAAELTGRLAPGDVLLLHDADDYSQPGCWQRTVRALPATLDEIERRGLRTVAL